MWWQGGRDGRRELEEERGGNSPVHLLSFSARYYPAEFLWQPLKKQCAVNCGFKMHWLIALCGGDGWLFRQHSPTTSNPFVSTPPPPPTLQEEIGGELQ